MNKKSKLIASILSITVLASSIFTIASFGGGIFVGSRADNNYSVTINKSSSVVDGSWGSNHIKLGSPLPGTGVKLLADINTSVPMQTDSHIIKHATNENGYVSFSFEDNTYGITRFQEIVSVQFTFGSTAQDFSILTSSTDKTFSNPDLYDETTANINSSTYSFADSGCRYLKLVFDDSNYTYIKDITINYSCSNSYVETRSLTSISLSGQTTNYSINDTFNFDGVCTAHYDDSSFSAVTPTNVSSPDMTTAGTKTVTVSYTENSITKTASYNISVSESYSFEDEINGTWESANADKTNCYTIVFDKATHTASYSCLYTYYGTEFRSSQTIGLWSYDEGTNTITLSNISTYTPQGNIDRARYFADDSRSTTTINNVDEPYTFKITLNYYSYGVSSVTSTFTKVA